MSEYLTGFALNSRAANYGDGCFTTIRVVGGHPQLLGYHVKRLKADCQTLGIDYPDHIEGEILAIAEKSVMQGVVKVVISRGDGGRGYSPRDCGAAKVYLSEHAYPEHYDAKRAHGVVLSLSDVRLSKQPLLAGAKHLNRLEQVLIKRAMPDDVDDCLVLDTAGAVIEASAGNLFAFSPVQNGWITPLLTECGVKGVMRAAVIDYFAQQNVQVEERELSVDHLLTCSRLFICNALMGMMPVKTVKINDTVVYASEPNSAEFNQLCADFCDWMSQR
ncbi:aminodeoxychorismate lyase [Alteromonas oceanisediminis]|uniref:aminodeoxychorismate lyase n=1 Tax=Alteromonas oceanisediminis TaxID=2836180 RepID=UPI001BD9D9C0|nr:aminodeoxychorismate lyase [Alteromonas oceanisediminis]MBT0586432.1 aminodeoxychorismate lyase [Alteromonas oceanisediminis]